MGAATPGAAIPTTFARPRSDSMPPSNPFTRTGQSADVAKVSIEFRERIVPSRPTHSAFTFVTPTSTPIA